MTCWSKCQGLALPGLGIPTPRLSIGTWAGHAGNDVPSPWWITGGYHIMIATPKRMEKYIVHHKKLLYICVCVCVFKFCYRYQEEVGWASHVFCGCGWEMLRTMLHPSWYVVKDNLSLPPPIDVIVFWTENPMGFSTSMLLLLLG